MSTGPSHPREPSSSVLCVLEEAQRLAYEPELSKLGELGVGLSYEDSPERAFELIDRARPDLVVVGMNVGMMEGLEFLAALMGRPGGYQGRVLMLPDKGDPFLPQLHQRDPATGKSTTESVHFAAVETLFRAPAPAPKPPVEPAPAEEPPVPPGPADVSPLVEPAHSLSPTTPAGLLLHAPVEARRAKRSWLPFVLAGVAVLVALGVAGALRGRTSSTASGAQPTRPAEPVPAVSISQARSPRAPEPAARPTQSERRSGLPVDLRKHQTLPLFFAKREAEFKVVDSLELDSMVATITSAMKERPKARLEVGGHTSKEGAGGFNFELGKRRAEETKSYLVKRGIPEARMLLKSYEAGLPVGPGEAELDASRRVTVRLLD